MSVREHEEPFSHMNQPPQSPDFTPLNVFGVEGKTEGMVPLSCRQYKILAKYLCNSGWI